EPCIKQLMDVYEQYQTSVVGVHTVPYEDVSKYGIITPLETKDYGPSVSAVKTLVEKPPREEAPSNLAIMGRYVLSPEIFPILEENYTMSEINLDSIRQPSTLHSIAKICMMI